MLSKKRGFTVIELLVVIAVIGLLSAIVLVSVKSAKDQAEFAKRKAFSQSIKSALGAYTKGEWTFDNGDFTDISGNLENGSSFGLDIVDGGLDGKGIRTIVGENSSFQIIFSTPKKISERGFTFEAWIYPYSSENPAILNFFHFQDNSASCGLFYFSTSLMFQCGCGADIEKDFKDLFEINKWNHIAAVMDGYKKEAKIYINGKLVASSPSSIPCGISISPDGFPNYLNLAELGLSPSVNVKFDQIRIYDGGF
jgi:prepilin-type N-terminal cleavage/methylation domain-containing protein